MNVNKGRSRALVVYFSVLLVLLVTMFSGCLGMITVSLHSLATTQKCRVDFSYNGQIIKSQNVTIGDYATPPDTTNFRGITYDDHIYDFYAWTDTSGQVVDVATIPINEPTTFVAQFNYYGFEPIQWTTASNLANLNGDNVWNDLNGNIYYSAGDLHLKLNDVTVEDNTYWQQQTWQGLTDFEGVNVWNDGSNVYYAAGNEQYVLEGHTWRLQKWTGLTNFYGRYVWQRGNEYFYSRGKEQYWLDSQNTAWQLQQWKGLDTFDGDNIWQLDGQIYYSSGTEHYQLSDNIWQPKIWDGLKTFNGRDVWDVGYTVYYASGTVVYRIQNNAWVETNDLPDFITSYYGQYVWHSFYRYYYSFHNIQNFNWQSQTYFCGRSISCVNDQLSSFNFLNNCIFDIKNLSIKLVEFMDAQQENYVWLPDGKYFWSDGVNTYFSFWSTQCQIDLKNRICSNKEWKGLDDFWGNNIWTDGINTYYSDFRGDYQLDQSSGSWMPIKWDGLKIFGGANVWRERNNVYYSEGNRQYVLDLDNKTWYPKEWNGLEYLYRDNIWTDGQNYYYSDYDTHYVLDVDTDTWIPIKWQGLDVFNGVDIWNGDGRIFYSFEYQHYELVKRYYRPEI